MATTGNIDDLQRYLYGGSTRTGTLSTADLGSFADENPNIFLAAEQAAYAEMMEAIAGGKKKVGDLEVDPGVVAGRWQTLAKQLRLRGVRQVKPYAGGVSIDDKRATETDKDWDTPESRRGQFDYDGGSTAGSGVLNF